MGFDQTNDDLQVPYLLFQRAKKIRFPPFFRFQVKNGSIPVVCIIPNHRINRVRSGRRTYHFNIPCRHIPPPEPASTFNPKALFLGDTFTSTNNTIQKEHHLLNLPLWKCHATLGGREFYEHLQVKEKPGYQKKNSPLSDGLPVVSFWFSTPTSKDHQRSQSQNQFQLLFLRSPWVKHPVMGFLH